MTIILNGNQYQLEAECSIAELLKKLGFDSKPVVVEHNQQAVFPRDYPTTTLNDTDQLEIILIAAGG